MPGAAMLAINENVTIPDAELHWSFARAGGPGGQNVNKVASKAQLRWSMAQSEVVGVLVKRRIIKQHPSMVTTEGDLLITSQEFRDQERNRQRCCEKLTDIVSVALIPPKPRLKTKPSKASKARRLAGKKQQAERKARRKPPGQVE
jgi:ribosome-associated protein